MKLFKNIAACLVLLFLCSRIQAQQTGSLFEYDKTSKTRWSSPENINGAKGQGGKANNGAKGHPSMVLAAGGTLDLLNIQGAGVINRIWITTSDLSPKTLRALTLQIFWDNETKPAVSVPIADFFGMGPGKMSAFKNALFASPEGKSFNCFIPMPFKKAARIQLVNEAAYQINAIYFDVDYQVKPWKADNLYFHAYWHRDTATTMGRDFELLPHVIGYGRMLGVNVAVNANPLYGKIWWGEGEVKIYLDGDKTNPTLIGTGTEDYIGDAWSQKEFFNDYAGCLISDDAKLQWTFYRYHVPDPVFFATDCKVTIQQMGSSFNTEVMAAKKAGAPMIPVSLDDGKGKSRHLYNTGGNFESATVDEKFAIFYRTDDVCATAYFYLDKPADGLPKLQPLTIRQYNLKAGK
jgi:hypothetical protein